MAEEKNSVVEKAFQTIKAYSSIKATQREQYELEKAHGDLIDAPGLREEMARAIKGVERDFENAFSAFSLEDAKRFLENIEAQKKSHREQSKVKGRKPAYIDDLTNKYFDYICDALKESNGEEVRLWDSVINPKVK